MAGSRRRQVNPEHAARIRDARAVEDAALVLVAKRTDALERATMQRKQAIGRYDAAVERARTELASAIEALVEVAGLDRTARTLDMSRSALRRVLAPTKPRTAARITDESAPDAGDSSFGAGA